MKGMKTAVKFVIVSTLIFGIIYDMFLNDTRSFLIISILSLFVLIRLDMQYQINKIKYTHMMERK